MSRPKSGALKKVVTLRLYDADLERFKARHPDWRAAIEAFVRGEGEPAAKAAPKPKPAPKVEAPVAQPGKKVVSRLKGEWKAP